MTLSQLLSDREQVQGAADQAAAELADLMRRIEDVSTARYNALRDLGQLDHAIALATAPARAVELYRKRRDEPARRPELRIVARQEEA